MAKQSTTDEGQSASKSDTQKGTTELTVPEVEFFVNVCKAVGETYATIAFAVSKLKADYPNLSESTFSSKIAAIEKKLGHPEKSLLNIKQGSGLYVTPLGRRLASGLRVSVDHFKQHLNHARTAIVRVGVTNAVAASLLPSVVAHALQNDSSALAYNIELVEGEAWTLDQLLDDGQIEFAISPNNSQRGHKELALCDWTPVLLYPRDSDFANWLRVFDLTQSIEKQREALAHFLESTTMLVPRMGVSPKLDAFLPPNGKRREIPQASLRLLWVERGLGIGFGYKQQFDPMCFPNLCTFDMQDILGIANSKMYLHIDKAHSAIQTKLDEPNNALMGLDVLKHLVQADGQKSQQLSDNALDLMLRIWKYCKTPVPASQS